jgi:hypothetical protein
VECGSSGGLGPMAQRAAILAECGSSHPTWNWGPGGLEEPGILGEEIQEEHGSGVELGTSMA